MLAPPGARLELLAGAVEGLACPSTRPPAPAWTSTAASVTAGAATTTSTVWKIKSDIKIILWGENIW